MSTVYIVVNEYQPEDSDNSSTEILGVYSSEDKAWEKIDSIAVQYGDYLDEDETEWSSPEAEAMQLEFDRYYIVEKEMDSDG